MLRLSSIPVAVLVVALASTALALDKKLVGKWTLDEIVSPRAVKPTEIQMELSLDGKNLVVHREVRREGEEPHIVDYVVKTDGSEHELPAEPGQTRTVTAEWKSSKLQLTYTMNRRGMDLDAVETWRVRKGKLEVVYKVKTPEAQFGWKEIYRRR